MNYVRGEIAKTVEVMQAIMADQALIDTVERIGELCAKSIAGHSSAIYSDVRIPVPKANLRRLSS